MRLEPLDVLDREYTTGFDASRHLPLAQDRSRSIASAAVTATGTTCLAAWVSGTPRSADSRQQARISAPVQDVSSGRCWLSGTPNWPRYICQMASFSLVFGKSMKNTPSKRSARVNSGGSFEMSLAVAMKKTSLS